MTASFRDIMNTQPTDILYRGFAIDWADYMDAYRVYDPRHPQQTLAYADTIESAKEHLDEHFGDRK